MSKKILITGSPLFLATVRSNLLQLPAEITATGYTQAVRVASRLRPDLVIAECEGRLQNAARHPLLRWGRSSYAAVILVANGADRKSLLEAARAGASDVILKPVNYREFIVRVNAVLSRKIRIVCIGGGTGLFSLLLGLKVFPRVLLTSVVSMTDDGGSSGKLRASFGILPPGDIRRSLVALSNAPQVMNEVLQYRFQKSNELAGHSFGNLFLTALTEIKGSMSEAVRGLGDILNVQGVVLPATDTRTTLCAKFEDGTVIKGESKISLAEGRHPDLRIRRVWHEPAADCNLNAYNAILHSDIVTIGPGDLFTSVVTNLMIRGMREAIAQTTARRIYICNLMTKPGETSHLDACQHTEEVVKNLGKGVLDDVILSNTPLSARAIREYARMNQEPVAPGDLKKIRKLVKGEVVLADVGHEEELVRHDSAKIGNEIIKLIGRRAMGRSPHA